MAGLMTVASCKYFHESFLMFGSKPVSWLQPLVDTLDNMAATVRAEQLEKHSGHQWTLTGVRKHKVDHMMYCMLRPELHQRRGE
jgi:hypothetical protein